jgi:predicted RNase H-like nuclease (RuvC/YqgF family)
VKEKKVTIKSKLEKVESGDIKYEVIAYNFGISEEEYKNILEKEEKEKEEKEEKKEEKKENEKVVQLQNKLKSLKEESEKLKVETEILKKEFGSFFNTIESFFSISKTISKKIEASTDEELILQLEEEIQSMEEHIKDQKLKYKEFNMNNLDSLKNANTKIISNFPKHDKNANEKVYTITWDSVMEIKKLEECFYEFLKKNGNE